MYASKDCTGALQKKKDKDGKETAEDYVTTYPQTWTVQTDNDGKATDRSENALSTCFGGKTYATTTAAAAGKLAAESNSPSPGLSGATTTMLSAGFGLLASVVAVMLM
jgi:hypothetical protein